MSESISRINHQLRDTFGFFHGKAKFRVVWSETDLEYRKGTFNEFYGDLFLRQETGIKQVKKYNYLRDRHVLEVATVYPHDKHDEIWNPEKISYEPVWVFENEQGPVPLIFKYIEMLCKAWLIVMEKDHRWAPTAEQLKERERQQNEKKIADLAEQLAHEAPNLAYGGGVVVPHNYGDTK